MAVNKVVYGNQTVMDITDSTVNASNLAAGEKAYGANGEPVIGALNLPTNITPSNSNPARMTTNTPVKPTANGYAIASYDSITPSSICEPFFRGDIVKFDGNGVVTDSPPIDITPSNSSPAAIPSNIPVKATTAGIAIESIDDVIYPYYDPQAVSADSIVKIGAYNGYVIDDYDDITPSSTPVSVANPNIHINGNSATIVDYIDDLTPTNIPENVSSGDNIHFEGSGVIMTTPASLTPSNVAPATITSGETYTATANGKAVSSVTDIIPSNGSPVPLSTSNNYRPAGNGYAIQSYGNVAPSNANPPNVHTGDICKITTRDGYLISTINIVEPSDSDPPLLSNDNSWYKLNGASGYLYHTIQPKVAVGTFTNSSSSVANVSVTIGFKPKYLCATYANNNVMVYDERHSTTKYYRCSSTPAFDGQYSLGSTSGNTIKSIDDDGFTIRSSANRTWNYFAIG